jgi:hypothetical protein
MRRSGCTCLVAIAKPRLTRSLDSLQPSTRSNPRLTDSLQAHPVPPSSYRDSISVSVAQSWYVPAWSSCMDDPQTRGIPSTDSAQSCVRVILSYYPRPILYRRSATHGANRPDPCSSRLQRIPNHQGMTMEHIGVDSTRSTFATVQARGREEARTVCSHHWCRA